MTLLVFLYVIFSRINQSRPEGILRCLVDGVQSQLSENILPMRIDSMETGEAFLGNLPGGHAQGDILQNLHLCTGKTDILCHTVLSRSQQNLCHSLTDIPLPPGGIAETIADFRER